MFKTVRTNFDRHEMRRDRRHPRPVMTVTIDGRDHMTVDWSLGGFQLRAFEVALGSEVEGRIRVAGLAADFAFKAQAVRLVEGEAGGVGFHFLDMSQALFDALDRAALRRFAGKQ